MTILRHLGLQLLAVSVENLQEIDSFMKIFNSSVQLI